MHHYCAYCEILDRWRRGVRHRGLIVIMIYLLRRYFEALRDGRVRNAA